jgi:hypothetical protein
MALTAIFRLYLEAIFTGFLLVLFIIYFPARRPKPPSATTAMLRRPTSPFLFFLLSSFSSPALKGSNGYF